MTNELLRVERVSKEYKMDGVVFRALHNVSLSIKKGEFVAIMGPSGSGKSTLMHIIGCLDRPSTGKVYIEGKDIFKAKDQELSEIRNTHIGFVFQQFNLLRKTPAVTNVELPLVYAHVTARERRARAVRLLSEVGLSEKAANFPSQLSGGQQQRVAIARALVTNPSIILADEPTGNLDSKSGREIMTMFQQLHAKGRTIVLVTHDEHVAAYAKRVIQIADGEVVTDARKRKAMP